MNTKLFFLFLFNLTFCIAQETITTKLVSTKSIDANVFIGADDFDHIYYLKNNTLYKQSSRDTLSFSNIAYGKIHTVDVHNPFKVVVFYKDFNAAIVLDSKLNAISDVINFNQETRFNNAEFLSYSSENNLWVFADDNRLHLYDFQNNQDKIQSQPITFYDDKFVAKQLLSTYKKVWIASTNKAFLFNEYGNYLETIPINNPTYIAPYKQGFIILKNQHFIYTSEHGNISITVDNINKIEGVYLNKSTLYIFDGKNIYAYKIN